MEFGKDGETTNNMVTRLSETLEATSGTVWNLVIILGGTNDLGCCRKPDRILEHLKKVHTICHEKKIPTIAVTIPQINSKSSSVDWLRENKRKLNEDLLKWAGETDQVVGVLDLYSKLTPDESNLWSGNLHF